MAIADLKSVLKIFGGSDVSEEERHELYKEVLCMTLSRAADADISIQGIEVDTIQAILKKHITEVWLETDPAYDLIIEPEIYWRRGGPPERRAGEGR